MAAPVDHQTKTENFVRWVDGFRQYDSPVRDIIQAVDLRYEVRDGERVIIRNEADGSAVGFHPYGALVAITFLVAAELWGFKIVSNIIPYSIRSEAVLLNKIAAGSVLFHMIGRAIDAVAKEAATRPAPMQVCTPA